MGSFLILVLLSLSTYKLLPDFLALLCNYPECTFTILPTIILIQATIISHLDCSWVAYEPLSLVTVSLLFILNTTAKMTGLKCKLGYDTCLLKTTQ